MARDLGRRFVQGARTWDRHQVVDVLVALVVGVAGEVEGLIDARGQPFLLAQGCLTGPLLRGLLLIRRKRPLTMTVFTAVAVLGRWCRRRLAIKTDLGSRIVRAWSIVPAAVNEREVAVDLLETGPPPRDLLADKGFNGKAFAASLAAQGTAVLVPPSKDQRQQMPPILRKVIAEWRNRIEASFGEITDGMELARHGAHTFWGLLARTAATIAAHTLLLVSRADLGGVNQPT